MVKKKPLTMRMSNLFWIVPLVLLMGLIFGFNWGVDDREEVIDYFYEQYDDCRNELSQTKDELYSLKGELCNVGINEFCGGGMFLYPCSDEGFRVCKPFFNGEFCVTYFCSENSTEIIPTYTVYDKGD